MLFFSAKKTQTRNGEFHCDKQINVKIFLSLKLSILEMIVVTLIPNTQNLLIFIRIMFLQPFSR